MDMRSEISRRPMARYAVIMFVIAAFLISTYPQTARACSCAGPIDLRKAIDESEAAFVGTLIDKRDTGQGQFGDESIYVFEVETWVKGDLGDRIEVVSASSGASCGLEFFDGDRTGAFLRMENGELRSSLCEQVDADALLAAASGPVISQTGIGHLLVGNGWSNPGLTVLDESGATVTELTPRGEPEPFTGTTQLEPCPGSRFAVQLVSEQAHVWDLRTLTISASYHAVSETGDMWVTTISCRNDEASSLFAVARSESGASLYELVPEWDKIIDLPGETWHICTSYVIAQMGHENDPTLVDIETGAQTRIHETPPGALQAINVAPHPSEERLAMLETRFSGEGPVESTLFILDTAGQTIESYEIPWESYSPTWVDDDRLLVQAYDFDDWQRSFGYVFDTSTGDTRVIDGWRGTDPVADGSMIYASDGGDVVVASLDTGQVDRLVTLPTQSAGPLVLLEEAAPVATTTTTGEPATEPTEGADTTTPPLLAPDSGGSDSDDLGIARWIAGIALVGFVGGLVLLARRPAD